MLKFGRYEVISELGKGAMGVVYNAHDPRIDRFVALKALHDNLVNDDYFVQRFFKEAVAIGRLSHPNIVTVYDVGQDHGTIYIAMELLKGRAISDLARERPFGIDEIVRIGIQTAEALDYAHGRGIVHRDIKPANIMLGEDNQVKITDFGIAHIEDVSSTLQTRAGEILGTPVYMSPEQVLGTPPDGRSDLYALGVILYELAAGKRPFGGPNMAVIFKQVTDRKPPAPVSVNPSIPRALSDIIMRCLEKNPDRRFQTGRDMAEALRALSVIKTEKRADGASVQRRRILKSIYAVGVLAFLLIAVVIGLKVFPLKEQVVEEPPKPPVETAMLTIESDPVDAEVFINGTLKGRTPLQIELPLGKQEVRMQLQDYYNWEAQIDLDQAGETPVFVKLNPVAD
ncbi:serine/threonine-protein kinase [Desulfococcus sp.]|uniref:serine/threonine-protein kinase n=1 Tax=Desulfococcus sp. TaxID=2025834 RepID=UPI003593233F